MALACLLPGVTAAQSQPAEPVESNIIPSTCPSMDLGPAVPPTPDRSQAPLVIYAREMSAAKEQEGEARGNVELFRADQHIATEHILFDPVNEFITIPE